MHPGSSVPVPGNRIVGLVRFHFAHFSQLPTADWQRPGRARPGNMAPLTVSESNNTTAIPPRHPGPDSLSLSYGVRVGDSDTRQPPGRVRASG
eukprot:1841996-Rhodomonas_salina.1